MQQQQHDAVGKKGELGRVSKKERRLPRGRGKAETRPFEDCYGSQLERRIQNWEENRQAKEDRTEQKRKGKERNDYAVDTNKRSATTPTCLGVCDGT